MSSPRGLKELPPLQQHIRPCWLDPALHNHLRALRITVFRTVQVVVDCGSVA